MAAGALAAADSLVVGTSNPPPATVPATDEAVEKEYKKLMDDDDTAQAEVDQWIRDNRRRRPRAPRVPAADLQRRIRERFEPIRRGYEDFILRHPNHARARVAFGSFLGDLQDEDGAQEQWEKALALNPKDPAVYNNLANLYGHDGPVKKAFEYYAKAIELNPREPLYYHNFGDHRLLVPQGRHGVLPASPSSRFLTKPSSCTARPSSWTPTISPSPRMSPRPTTASNRCASRTRSRPGPTPWPSPTTKSSAKASIFTSPGSSSRPTASPKPARTSTPSPTTCTTCSRSASPATSTSRNKRGQGATNAPPSRRPGGSRNWPGRRAVRMLHGLRDVRAIGLSFRQHPDPPRLRPCRAGPATAGTRVSSAAPSAAPP